MRFFFASSALSASARTSLGGTPYVLRKALLKFRIGQVVVDEGVDAGQQGGLPGLGGQPVRVAEVRGRQGGGQVHSDGTEPGELGRTRLVRQSPPRSRPTMSPHQPNRSGAGIASVSTVTTGPAAALFRSAVSLRMDIQR
ncbi:hypothetical protein [Streptomyces sp. NPDC059010]|uniref:hypothetical protein n=1 Tax=Streptomyces sp. NPDC059010 TaxID=3346695 RepID=UPI0036BF55ED